MESIYLNSKRIYIIRDKDDFLNDIIEKKKVLIAMNARKIISNDNRLSNLINNNIAYPDGKSVVMGINQKGYQSLKYPGFMMWYDLVKKYYQIKSFYLIGAKEEVILKTVEKLKVEFDGIKIRGFHNGYIDSEKRERLIKDIQNKKPDVVLVAMGSPIQEFFIEDLFDKHKALYMGLGGSFDVYVGNVKPVPWWWEKYIASEGLYRVFQDPKKLKRQINVIKFLSLYYRKKL